MKTRHYIVLCTAFIVYVLPAGPIAAHYHFYRRGQSPADLPQALATLYSPVENICKRSSRAASMFEWYRDLWKPPDATEGPWNNSD